MSLLSDRDLAEMRAAQEEAMPTSCTVQRVSEASDSYGGMTPTWATLASYSCRDMPLSSLNLGVQEGLLAGRVASGSERVITLPYDATCTAKDRIVIGSRTLEVLGVAAVGDWQTALRVLCKEITS